MVVICEPLEGEFRTWVDEPATPEGEPRFAASLGYAATASRRRPRFGFEGATRSARKRPV
jgi:hypothetical protein